MAYHGRRLVTAEFAVGVVGPLGLGLLSLGSVERSGLHGLTWPLAIGIELVGIGLNYLPLLFLARRLGHDAQGLRALKQAIRNDPREARSYSVRQAWILCPGAVIAFAFWRR